MTDLAEFLRARLDEDEQAAQATLDTAARVARLRGLEVPRWKFADMQVRSSDDILIVKHTWPAEGEHIARHDPARVLREVEAKRRLIDEIADLGHCPGCTGDPTMVGTAHECPTDGARMRMLPLLALPYADHPDYRQEWRP